MLGDKYVVEHVRSGWSASRYKDRDKVGFEKYGPGNFLGWGSTPALAIKDIRKQELRLKKMEGAKA